MTAKKPSTHLRKCRNDVSDTKIKIKTSSCSCLHVFEEAAFAVRLIAYGLCTHQALLTLRQHLQLLLVGSHLYTLQALREHCNIAQLCICIPLVSVDAQHTHIIFTIYSSQSSLKYAFHRRVSLPSSVFTSTRIHFSKFVLSSYPTVNRYVCPTAHPLLRCLSLVAQCGDPQFLVQPQLEPRPRFLATV
jgi:hypothetical protein